MSTGQSSNPFEVLNHTRNIESEAWKYLTTTFHSDTGIVRKQVLTHLPKGSRTYLIQCKAYPNIQQNFLRIWAQINAQPNGHKRILRLRNTSIYSEANWQEDIFIFQQTHTVTRLSFLHTAQAFSYTHLLDCHLHFHIILTFHTHTLQRIYEKMHEL